MGQFFKDCHQFLSQYVPFDGDNLFVAGGFFPRKFHNLKLRDIDVFVNSQEYLEFLLEEYKNLDWQVKTQEKYNLPGTEGPKRIHYLCTKQDENEHIEIDLVPFHDPKSPEYIKTFDLNICQIAMDENFVYFVDEQTVINDLSNKHMRFTGNCKETTFHRVVKYTKLGYEMTYADMTNVSYMYMNKEFLKTK